ncbi:TonB-dependent receptor plug domain-containing protein [Ichthyenterobacterium sp. W332]|uniref:TonB-dependent receptor plug domain-containing protein n=1 Tax=Microcosmobacter mediterraneus TaxID=3075607 RepID=A0ABU2YMN9_9FLAO|nr:TonB-dependent receptor plug domain-containing protein [Ichthyenterobacterium sp. W332]MDT0559429.1 TonB-dependent receptor plug domain-containing protein [Ichthyenterobacterium sp. W332]
MKTRITFLALLIVVTSQAQFLETNLSIQDYESLLNPETECVNLGYYKIEKSKLTTAVVEVSTEQLNERPIVTIDQLLQRRVAGLNVSTTSYQPGEQVRMGIRGRTHNNGPLVILDGAPIQLSSLWILNPHDVDTITVLKDAGSTAIYGMRGGNGVIVITTKRG